MKQHIVILFFIVLLAGFLRFNSLSTNPPSLTWDEVSWGYNAYTLGIDGKDEFGRFLPLNYLESFGDFKPPMYAYLAVIPVKILGMTEFSTRFPSAFFGTLTVLLTFYLTTTIFYSSKHKVLYGLTAALLLSISPWHINLSRAAFEANIASFFIICGVVFFLRFTREKSWNLYLSAAAFVLSMYTFNTSRIVAPLLVMALTIGFHRLLWEKRKDVARAALFGLIILLPTLPFLFTPQASLRFKEVNIFTDSSVVKRANEQIANDGNVWWSKILHNRRFGYSVSFVTHYFDNLDPKFLFIQGDGNPKFSTQQVGQMYLWSLPFFVSGVLFLCKKKEGSWWIIPVWLLLGIIPAATARETPHALRIEVTLPTFQLLAAYGFSQFVLFLKERVTTRSIRYAVLGILALALMGNVLYYLHGYYVHYPYQYSSEWQYGYKESIAYVKAEQNKYDEVVITPKLGRTYSYYLFYLQTDPAVFRNTAVVKRDTFGFVSVERFDKYVFPKDMPSSSANGKRILYIGDGITYPKGASVQKIFRLVNGEPILSAYTL